MRIRHPYFWLSILLLVTGALIAVAPFPILFIAKLRGVDINAGLADTCVVLLYWGIGLFTAGAVMRLVQYLTFNAGGYPARYIKKIKSQEKIAHIYTHADDPRFRREALEHLTNEAVLLKYAKSLSRNPCKEPAKNLIKKIHSPEGRHRVVLECDLECCAELLHDMSDISLLKEIAAQAADNKVKRWAANRALFLEDPVKFFDSADVFLEEKEAYARDLKDEELCARIAILSEDKLKKRNSVDIGKIVLQKVATPSIIEQLLLRANDKSCLDVGDIRKLLQKISVSPRHVIDRALSARVREEALGLVDDEDMLMDICLNHPSSRTRRDAAWKIKNQVMLWSIAKNSSDIDILKDMIRRLEFTSEDHRKFLEHLAANHKDDDVRNAAVQHIASQELLEEIARTDKAQAVRISAARLLDDEKLCASLMRAEGLTAQGFKPGRYKISGSGNITIQHCDGSQSSYAVHNAANDYGYSPSEEVRISELDVILNASSVDWERLGS